jgi:hypothetical protein
MLTHLAFERIIFVNERSKKTLFTKRTFNESWVSQQVTLPSIYALSHTCLLFPNFFV